MLGIHFYTTYTVFNSELQLKLNKDIILTSFNTNFPSITWPYQQAYGKEIKIIYLHVLNTVYICKRHCTAENNNNNKCHIQTMKKNSGVRDIRTIKLKLLYFVVEL